MKNFLSKGQTLLEAIIAVGVLAIVLTAAASAVVTSINNANFTTNENLANKYAQDGIEYLRNLKTKNYPAFIGLLTPTPGGTSRYCMPQLTPIPKTTTTCDCSTSPSQCIHERTGVLIRETTVINTADIPNPTPRPCQVVPVVNPTPVNGFLVTVSVKWTSGRCPLADRYCHASVLQTCLMPPIQ